MPHTHKRKISAQTGVEAKAGSDYIVKRPRMNEGVAFSIDSDCRLCLVDKTGRITQDAIGAAAMRVHAADIARTFAQLHGHADPGARSRHGSGETLQVWLQCWTAARLAVSALEKKLHWFDSTAMARLQQGLTNAEYHGLFTTATLENVAVDAVCAHGHDSRLLRAVHTIWHKAGLGKEFVQSCYRILGQIGTLLQDEGIYKGPRGIILAFIAAWAVQDSGVKSRSMGQSSYATEVHW